MPTRKAIPVVDIFAGPGGLGEGFASFRSRNEPTYQPALSIEKDPAAHRTLKLRAFFRQFPDGRAPNDYYDYLRGQLTLDQLYANHPERAAHADREAWCAELGQAHVEKVRSRIQHALDQTDPWVLLGGPPCQPFSLAGRSRNAPGTKTQYSDGKDTRHQLYVEYLQIIADFWPAVFVMENVRGMLSANYNGQPMFDRIRTDLANPAAAIKSIPGRTLYRMTRQKEHRYFLHALNPPTAGKVNHHDQEPDFLIRCEHYGIPQARHRVILVGVREDLATAPRALRPADCVPSNAVLDGLPALRGGLTPQHQDSPFHWEGRLLSALASSWLRRLERQDPAVHAAVYAALHQISYPPHDRGADFLVSPAKIRYRPDWFLDPRLGGVCNHATRGHMPSDLHRYLFAACFAQAHGQSPSLADFPKALLPAHRNARNPDARTKFADRFRVQLRDRPATTVVSHIAKDGHYYIHPDPTQCRSLTVREAARLQTFPDNYRFVGTRTEQYHQVGNAVPQTFAT
jgi:DNA (cytosine-5)-methyltransferase 1